ncbi:MAG: hypothetical protein ACK2UH_17655, partial [Candidatus Promineifilaceae bacterium]
AGALAFHFFQAQDFERALHYYTLAGDVAYRLFAVVEAVDFYNHAIDCAGKVDAVTSEQLVHLYTRRGRAYELDNKFEEALANYQAMIELAREREDGALRLASLTAQLIVRATGTPLHDPPKAKALADEALPLAQELGDRATEARVLWGLLLWSIYGGGSPELGLDYGRRSLAIAREIGDTEQIAYTLHNMAARLMGREQFEESQRVNLEARAAWLELGNTPMLADSYIVTASLQWFAGNFEAVISAAGEALRISRSIGNKWIQSVAPFYTSLAFLEQGDVGRALEYLRQGLEIAEQEGITFFKFAGTSNQILLYWSLGALDRADPLVEKLYQDRDQMVFGFYTTGLTRAARIKLALGDLAQAQKIQAESLQDLDKDSLPLWVMGEVTVTEALLHLTLGQPEEALSEAQRLIEKTKRAGLKANLTEARLVQGKALAILDELEEAANTLREAARLAEEIGQRRLLWQILAALAEVETRQGNA